MNTLKKISSLAVASLLMVGGMELGENLGIPGGGYVSKAEARVGRPLTPVSYAGVARRTTRRVVARRTAVHVSTLPAGCVYGPYHGAHYYHCGSVYYQQSGTVYVKVVFE